MRNRYIKWALILLGLVVVVVVYTLFNPGESGFFPRCPFRWLIGLECPGCGSQRAVHHLLHLRIGAAMGENILLVIFIPYLVVGFIFDMTKNPSPQMAVWRKRLYGTRAIAVVLTVIILFWVLRNIPYFADYL